MQSYASCIDRKSPFSAAAVIEHCVNKQPYSCASKIDVPMREGQLGATTKKPPCYTNS